MPLRLRPFEEGDFATLIPWVPTSDALSQWCGAFFTHPLDHAQLRRYLDSARVPNTREIFAVVDGDATVGHAELSMIWPHLSCRLSRVLVDPERRGRGLGRELVRLAVAHGFGRHDVDRIDLGVSRDNEAAIRVYARAGFQPVGIWPRAIAVDHRTIDVAWMTLTRADWAT